MNFNRILFIATSVCIAMGFIAWPKFNTPKHFAREIDDPTELDRHVKLREMQMLADPVTGKIPANVRMQEMEFYNYTFDGKRTRGDKTIWKSSGPWNVGGRTRALAIDVTNENIIIAGGVSGGIFRSTDAGKTWTLTSDSITHQGIVSVCQDLSDGKQNIWYAISGEAAGNSASGGGAYYLGDGAYKSTDSGKSWQLIASTATGIPSTFSTNLQVCWRIKSHASGAVFLAAYGAIYKSTDEGNTFNFTLGDNANQSYYTDIEIADNGDIYATLSSDGATRGFYRSTDTGNSWANITPTSLLTTYERTVMGINPNNNKEVYFFSYLPDSTNVAGEKSSNFQGDAEWISLLKYNYVSGNGAGTGGTWADLSGNLPLIKNNVGGGFDKLNCQGGYDMYVKVQPITNNIFIAGTNIFRSTDGFKTPNNTKQVGGYGPGTSLPNFTVYKNHHPDCHDLIFFKSNYKKMLCASDGGVHLCNDALAPTVEWISLNNGYLTTQPYTVTLDPSIYSGWLLSGFQDNGNYVTTNYRNAQKSWYMPFNGDGAFNYIAQNKDFFLMSTQEGKLGIFKLNENGYVIRRRRIDPIGPSKDDYVFINPFCVDPTNDNILYLPAGKSVWRQNKLRSLAVNDDWNKTSEGWVKLADTITTVNTTGGTVAQITAIAASKNPAHVVYCGTNNRELYRIDNAHLDNAKMVKLTNPNVPSTVGRGGSYVSSIAVDPDDASKVFVVYSNYNITSIFYSLDAGITWLRVAGNLEKGNNFSGTGPSVRWLSIMKRPDGTKQYFAATSIGLYSTTNLYPSATVQNDTTKWQQEGLGSIGTAVVNHISIRDIDQTVAISTHGKGTFVADHGGNNVNPNPGPNATIYPNPVTQFGSIKLDNWGADNLTLRLVSMTGATVKRAQYNGLNGVLDVVEFNTATLARGNYIAEITSSSGKYICKKIVLLP
jgi:photosystem II stability/assembly factor-like uncharacterized protein